MSFVRKIRFKNAFLKAISSGVLPDTIAKGKGIVFEPAYRRISSKFCSLPASKTVEVNVAQTKIQEQTKTDVIHKPQQYTAVKKSITPIKPTAMDIDIAKHRMQTLKELATIYGDDYIANSLSYHCEEAGKESLKLERRAFYKLFGAKPETRELMALFIANLASSGNPSGIKIINGLIKYFEQFATWLNDNLTNFNSIQAYKPNKLFDKYLRFGRDDVYKLIGSISKKITVTCRGINNESIFPEVNNDIHKIFGSLQPIEF